MTQNRPFKNRVRERMDKTGERYTAARRHLADPADTADTADTAEAAAAASTGPEPAGVSAMRAPEDAVRERTGRTPAEWFALLDAWGARRATHADIARHLTGEHAVEGWWAQSLTVSYEQSRGMRAPGQRADGTFSATASKTVAADTQRLFAAFADPALREQWLPGAPLNVRTATAPTSFRADWTEEPAGRLAVAFTAKGPHKAVVGLEHERLADAESAAAMKAHWRERLAALKVFLEES